MITSYICWKPWFEVDSNFRQIQGRTFWVCKIRHDFVLCRNWRSCHSQLGAFRRVCHLKTDMVLQALSSISVFQPTLLWWDFWQLHSSSIWEPHPSFWQFKRWYASYPFRHPWHWETRGHICVNSWRSKSVLLWSSNGSDSKSKEMILGIENYHYFWLALKDLAYTQSALSWAAAGSSVSTAATHLDSFTVFKIAVTRIIETSCSILHIEWVLSNSDTLVEVASYPCLPHWSQSETWLLPTWPGSWVTGEGASSMNPQNPA